jgi:hypothetical protein
MHPAIDPFGNNILPVDQTLINPPKNHNYMKNNIFVLQQQP